MDYYTNLYIFYIFILIEFLLAWDSLFMTAEIYTLVLSLFLFLVTLSMTRNNYLIIGNSILAIITVPVADVFFIFYPEEIGGYALSLCFALLYGIAVLKLVFRQILHQPSLTDTPG